MKLIHTFTAILLLIFSVQAMSTEPNYEGEGSLFDSGADMAAFLQEAPLDEILELMDYLEMPLECVDDICENYAELVEEAEQQMTQESIEEYYQPQASGNTTCTPP